MERERMVCASLKSGNGMQVLIIKIALPSTKPFRSKWRYKDLCCASLQSREGKKNSQPTHDLEI